MAKLLSYFNLCPIMDSKDFLGVAEDKEEGTIINTLGKNIVIIIKLNSQKQMKSWITIDKLTTKVVYDKESDRYVGGFGNNYLKCWSETTEDLKKIKRTKTAKPIQDILSVDGSTIIVFTDGSCSALDTIISNVKSPSNYTWTGPVTDKALKIIKVESHTDNSGEVFLTLLVSTDEKETSLFYYKVPSSEEEAILAPTVSVIRLKRDNVKLLNSCVVQASSGLILLSIWSDKRMMRQEIREDISESDVGQFVEMINFVNLEEPFSISSPAKNYIAVYGGNVQQEGSSLMLYNIQYNLIEAKQQFKVLFNNSRLWSLGSNIMLVTGQSLSVFPFYVADEELLHIIGSKKSCADQPALQNDMIDEGNDEQMLIEFGLNMPPARHHMEERQKPITNAEFDEMVETLVCTTTSVGLFERNNGGGEGGPITIAINEDPREALSMPLRVLVKAMEKQGFSEMEITNEVIPELINHNATVDLMHILRKYTTVSESVLAACLHSGIRSEDKALLARIMSVDFEEEYMIYNLRKKLAIEDVLYFVQFLYECLAGSYSCADDIHDMDLCETVLKWLTCLVDAHYTNILLSKSQRMARQFMKWRVLIEKHINGLQQLGQFSALVERMALAKTTKVATSSKWYNIEVVRI